MRKITIFQQSLISAVCVILVAVLLFTIATYSGYYVVAFILLFLLSLLAMLFDIIPVLVAAVLSALIWNFFFIPPLFTFHIEKVEDILLFLMYFVIALLNAVLTFKFRKEEQKARDKEEKEKTIQLYNTLLNSLSHELRTPIATIIGAVDTLQGDDVILPEQSKKQLLEEIEKAGTRLNRQVENLLNMSRLESGILTLSYDWCDFSDIISATISKLDNFSQRIDCQLDDNLPLFKLDSSLIEEILYNILHNAIQYTSPTTQIELSVAYKNEQCVIEISDNGKGFPEAQIPFVFDKFYRLPQSKTGGTGLGLSIVKGFVTAHQGTIALQNNAKGGATFTITIPCEANYINQLKNE